MKVLNIILCCALLTLLTLSSSAIGQFQYEYLISNKGSVLRREIMPSWSISRHSTWGVSDINYAINVSRYIKATAVLLLIHWWDIYLDSDGMEFIADYIARYKAAGFRVYLSVGWKYGVDRGPYHGDLMTYPTPQDLEPLLTFDVEGIGWNMYGTIYDGVQATNSLLDMLPYAQASSKELAYYHGDGLDYVNATKVGLAGVVVWAWAGPNWKPGYDVWFVPSITIWAQNTIINRTWTDGTFRYTTKADIIYWYEVNIIQRCRKPEAIVWWLSDCRTVDTDPATSFHPSEEQIEGMRLVAEEFFGSAS